MEDGLLTVTEALLILEKPLPEAKIEASGVGESLDFHYIGCQVEEYEMVEY